MTASLSLYTKGISNGSDTVVKFYIKPYRQQCFYNVHSFLFNIIAIAERGNYGFRPKKTFKVSKNHKLERLKMSANNGGFGFISKSALPKLYFQTPIMINRI
jgi:hypothetical protein